MKKAKAAERRSASESSSTSSAPTSSSSDSDPPMRPKGKQKEKQKGPPPTELSKRGHQRENDRIRGNANRWEQDLPTEAEVAAQEGGPSVLLRQRQNTNTNPDEGAQLSRGAENNDPASTTEDDPDEGEEREKEEGWEKIREGNLGSAPLKQKRGRTLTATDRASDKRTRSNTVLDGTEAPGELIKTGMSDGTRLYQMCITDPAVPIAYQRENGRGMDYGIKSLVEDIMKSPELGGINFWVGIAALGGCWFGQIVLIFDQTPDIGRHFFWYSRWDNRILTKKEGRGVLGLLKVRAINPPYEWERKC
ncbi:hypothetical protein F4802DRAFT_537957 [Xylaria palmicola]|nr:hypothetical protein F4802DRAFT_537957 [Xylaria palmicola]